MVRILGLNFANTVNVWGVTYYIKARREGDFIRVNFYADNQVWRYLFHQEIQIPRRWAYVIVPWPSNLATTFVKIPRQPGYTANIPENNIYYPDIGTLIQLQNHIQFMNNMGFVLPAPQWDDPFDLHEFNDVLNEIQNENIVPPAQPIAAAAPPAQPRRQNRNSLIVTREEYERDCNDECPICMEKYKVKQSVETSCKHLFCNSCFQNTFRNVPQGVRKNCPICRQNIVHTFKYTTRATKFYRVKA